MLTKYPCFRLFFRVPSVYDAMTTCQLHQTLASGVNELLLILLPNYQKEQLTVGMHTPPTQQGKTLPGIAHGTEDETSLIPPNHTRRLGQLALARIFQPLVHLQTEKSLKCNGICNACNNILSSRATLEHTHLSSL